MFVCYRVNLENLFLLNTLYTIFVLIISHYAIIYTKWICAIICYLIYLVNRASQYFFITMFLLLQTDDDCCDKLLKRLFEITQT